MTLSIAQVAMVLILGVSSFLSGWMLRRIQAKAREAALRKQIDSTHNAVPSLETSVRNRDQRIATLVAELSELKTKLPSLEVAAKRKDVDVLAKDRELRAAEARIAALTGKLAERDARLAVSTASPSFISLPVAPVSASAAELEAVVDRLRNELIVNETARREAQKRVDAEVERAKALEATLVTRDSDVERERTEAAKWQARVPKLLATIKARETALAERDQQAAQYAARLAQGDAQIAEHAQRHAGVLAERDAQLMQYAEQLAERDAQMARYAEQLSERDAQLDHHAASLAQRDAELELRVSEVATRDAMVSQRDAAIDERDAAIYERDAAIDERDRMLAQRDGDVQALETALAERDAMLVEQDQRIVSLDQRVNGLIAERDAEATQQTAKLATALRLGREEVDRHRAEFQMIRDELEAERQQHAQTAAAAHQDAERHASIEAELTAHRESLAAHATSLGAQLTALQDQLAEHVAARHADAELRGALERELGQAHDERSAVEAQFASLDEQRIALEARLAGADELHSVLEERLSAAIEHADAAEARAARADEQSKAIEAQRAAAEEQRSLAESHLEAARADYAALAQDLERMRVNGEAHASRELAAAQEAKAALERDFEEQAAELAEMRAEVRELHTRIAPLESLLKQRDTALAERAEKIETLAAQVQALATQNETQQTMLRQRGERIAALERKAAEAPPLHGGAATDPDVRNGEHLEERLVEQIEKNRELANALEDSEREMAAAVKAKDLNEKSMLVLKQQLDDARATEDRLATQLRELKAASQRAPETPAAPARATMSKPAGLYELPPEQVDELQQIRGIGDGFERGLNKLGIYQFSQLAGLSAAEIVWIEAHLPTFHGRIERDDWPGQAAALMAASQHAEWSLRAQSPRAESPRIN
jgi:predicted flap endonuclease-1-like 5' DNA nuclease